MKKKFNTVAVNTKQGPNSIGPIVLSKAGAWIESVMPSYETKEVRKESTTGFWPFKWSQCGYEFKKVQNGFCCNFGVGSKTWTISAPDKKELEKFRKSFIKAID